MNYTQGQRFLQISDVGLGSDALLIIDFSGTEYISRPFSFEIDVLSSELDITPEQIIGKEVTVTIKGEQDRYFHGYIHSFVFGEVEENNLRHYQLTMAPWLWFLSQTNNHRIFQHKNTKEIVSQIFQDLGFNDFEFRAQGGAPREYCIQHNESDLDFVTRLLAEDGISYFFQHQQGKHQLILVDQHHAYEPCAENQLECSHGSNPKAQISRWQHHHYFKKGLWSLNDYDFKTSQKDLESQTNSLSQFKDNKKFEHYEYPGLYGSDLGTNLTKMRMEAEEAQRHSVKGQSNYKSLYAGGMFSLVKHTTSTEKGKYVLTSISHKASEKSYTVGQSAEATYVNYFTCVPDSVYIRPQPRQRPVMRGPQTAIVVGPAGEEIYVDEFGRIKVQFIWDREGKKDENSSCFLRVAQTWAGKKWGASFIPRIGHEVIVDFFDGDPDRPYVSGSMYNGQNLPPYSSKTQSGIKSRSTKGGSASNFNEIRFDDKKGAEQVYIHAEKNQDNVVENDETTNVGHDRTESVGNDEKINIGGNRVETVSKNEAVTISIAKALTIGAAYQVSVGAAKNETVGLSSSEQVGLIKDVRAGKSINLVAVKDISISTGASSIVLKSNGEIKIDCKKLQLNGSDNVTITGGIVDINP